MDKFTKGEWVLSADKCVYASVGGDYKKIAHVSCVDVFASCEEKANAHLIRTSPKMYRLLHRIMTEHCNSSILYNEIDELLEKARGES